MDMEPLRVESMGYVMMSRVCYGKMQCAYAKHGFEMMAFKLEAMYAWLGFSHDTAKELIQEQGMDNPNRLRALTNKNVDDICNIIRKCSKSTDGLPDRAY